jgi:hypothetical protein
MSTTPNITPTTTPTPSKPAASFTTLKEFAQYAFNPRNRKSWKVTSLVEHWDSDNIDNVELRPENPKADILSIGYPYIELIDPENPSAGVTLGSKVAPFVKDWEIVGWHVNLQCLILVKEKAYDLKFVTPKNPTFVFSDSMIMKLDRVLEGRLI